MNQEIICPTCHLAYTIHTEMGTVAQYCPYCRSCLKIGLATTICQDTKTGKSSALHSPLSESALSVSFLPEHLPKEDAISEVIGPYQVLNSIGKGGMGEVFLAYDTTCGRKIALKKIRPDLLTHQTLHNRFLKEARITSQLIHPAIIPIFAIHSEGELTYYTMPYIEGQTLKQILKDARKQEKNGGKIDHLAHSIPTLIRIFLSICQAIAYAHSKHVLHRDLKPENIIVGQYGQIVILDWGLAKIVKDQNGSTNLSDVDIEEEESQNPLHQLTHVGKVVGTVSYMAPERATGSPATFQTDIYSLGVILYQMLTLKHPFKRASLKEFREELTKERLIEPSEIAPYRDVPKSLSRVVRKALHPSPMQRYLTVDDLIHDIENYIEGRSEWFQIAELDIKKKSDWEFQENVLLAEHIALTKNHDTTNWVSLMISKASFQENIKIQTKVMLGIASQGIGFLLCIPEAAERTLINDGLFLWIGSEINKSTKLIRSSVEVMHSPEIFLKQEQWYFIEIEKVDTNIHFYLDGEKQFSYISHLPLAGTHIGLLAKDANFNIKDLFVLVGSQNVTVNCLAVPDAFLAHKEYTIALNEYRRIGYSFAGRAEGREAMFRAGITLLEQANNSSVASQKLKSYDLALEEFGRLHDTPGAPLEYLGKALVYQALHEYEEEAKCFELAYRRYPKHPLLKVIEEQMVYRMYASSRTNRNASFHFLLLTLRFLPEVAGSANTKKLLIALNRFWEELDFLEYDLKITTSKSLSHFVLILKLSFWLNKPYVIEEMIAELNSTDILHEITFANAIFCLIELGAAQIASDALEKASLQFGHIEEFNAKIKPLKIALRAYSSSLEEACEEFLSLSDDPLSHGYQRVQLHLIKLCLDKKFPSLALALCNHKSVHLLSDDAKLKIDAYKTFAYLQNKEWESAQEVLFHYPIERLSQDSTLLHFLYGCLLFATEGKEIAAIHFSGVFEVPYPRSWNLFSYYLKGDLFEPQGWISKSFYWERRELYRQLALYYSCVGDEMTSEMYRKKI